MASEAKRYYWLKLRNTYFSQLEQKKMKRQEHGKDMQIIYLRMMLYSIDKGGIIYYQGVFETLEEELAEEFDEPIEIVRKTLDYLTQNNMITIDRELNCFIPAAVECTGSESYSAERMRRHRENAKASHCDNTVTSSDAAVTEGDEELEIELEKDINTCSPKPDERESDFQKIYAIYPKKRGRTKAFSNYCLWLKGKAVNGKRIKLNNRQMYIAVKNYVEQQEQAGTDEIYYKNFDTLMGAQLLDYVEEGTK